MNIKALIKDDLIKITNAGFTEEYIDASVDRIQG